MLNHLLTPMDEQKHAKGKYFPLNSILLELSLNSSKIKLSYAVYGRPWVLPASHSYINKLNFMHFFWVCVYKSIYFKKHAPKYISGKKRRVEWTHKLFSVIMVCNKWFMYAFKKKKIYKRDHSKLLAETITSQSIEHY